MHRKSTSPWYGKVKEPVSGSLGKVAMFLIEAGASIGSFTVYQITAVKHHSCRVERALRCTAGWADNSFSQSTLSAAVTAINGITALYTRLALKSQ